MNEAKILIVEDEKKLNTMLADYLGISGFRTLQVYGGKEAIAIFEKENIDLIILDLMIPDLDGLDIARHIRLTSSVPIIILTARATEADKLIGLEIGADDYVVKPFSFKELVARIRAVLRRTRGDVFPSAGPVAVYQPSAGNTGVLRFRELLIDSDKRIVRKAGKAIRLTGTQFEILKGMMHQPGKVFTRLELLNFFQQTSFEGYERTIDTHIKNLRKALETDTMHPEYIQTIWGVGYKLSEES